MEISTLITIVTSCLLTLILVFSFMLGFWRGVKRSVISLVTTVAMFLLAFFLAPAISKVLLGIEIEYGGANMTISDIIIKELSTNATFESLINASPALTSFIQALPLFLLNLVVFVLVFFILRMIGYIIYKIIAATTLMSAKKEKVLEVKRNRWVGGLIGVSSGLVFTILTFAPFTALTGFAAEIQKTDGYYGDANITSGLIPEDANKIVDLYNDTAFAKTTQCFGFDNVMFDHLASFKVEDKSVNIRQDAIIAVKMAQTFSAIAQDVSSSRAGASLQNINWKDFEKDFDKLLSDGVFEGLIFNMMGDLVENYQDIDMLNQNESVKNILQELSINIKDKKHVEYFKHDTKLLFDTFEILGKSAILDKYLFNNTLSLEDKFFETFSKENEDNIKTTLNSLLSVNLVKDTFKPVLELTCDNLLKGSGISVNTITVNNFNTHKETLKKILESGYNILNNIEVKQITQDPIKALNLTDAQVEILFSNTGGIFDDIETLPLTSGGSKSFVETILEDFVDGDVKSVHGEDIDSFEEFLCFAGDIIKEINKLEIYNSLENEKNVNDIVLHIAEKLSSEEANVSLNNILIPIFKMEVVRENYFDQIEDAINTVDDSIIDISKLTQKDENGNYLIDQSIENWDNELDQVTNVLKALSNNNIKESIDGVEVETSVLKKLLNQETTDIFELVKDIDKTVVDDIIKPILYAKSTKPLVETLMDTIKTELEKITGAGTITLDINSITLNKNDAEDQAQEICDILSAVIDILPQGDGAFTIESISYEKLGLFLDKLKENGYRVEIDADNSEIQAPNKKQEVGLFKSTFDAIIAKVEDQYSQIVTIKGSKEYYELNFEETMTLVQDFSDISDIVDSEVVDGEKVLEKVEDIVKSITPETEEQINNIIDIVEEELGEETIEVPEEQKDNIESILDAIQDDDYDGGIITDSNGDAIVDSEGNEITMEDVDLNEETIKNIKDFLGIATKIAVNSTVYAVGEVTVLETKFVELTSIEISPQTIIATAGTGENLGKQIIDINGTIYVVGNTKEDGTGLLTLTNGAEVITAK